MVVALSPKEKKPDIVNNAIRELQQGRNNASGTFTLTPNATTTVVTAINCSPTSVVLWSPQTQDAANDMATTSYVAAKGQFTLTHANNARVDRTFGFVVLGGN